MGVTLEELAARVDQLESDLREVRGKVQHGVEPEATHTQSGGPFKGLKIAGPRERRVSAAAAGSIAAKMGAKGPTSIGAKALQERLRAEGFGDDNQFCRMVREMREE